MRKKTRMTLDRMVRTVGDLSKRINMLECEHEPTAAIKRWYNIFWEEILPVGEWQLKCHKCGKVLRDLTEKEYLVAKLEHDEHSFLGINEVMKRRLEEINKEDEPDA